MKKLVSLFLVLVLLFSAALAEDAADEAVEEIVEDVMLDDEEDPEDTGTDDSAAVPDQSVFTPSYGSPWQSAPGASSYWTLPMELDKMDYAAYAANPRPFYVVCTDVETGEAVYKHCPEADGEYRDWFRASASMPLVSHVVEAGGRKLLDGGIADSVPIRYFESIGYERNVVILTQPEGFVKTASRGQLLLNVLMRKYPKLAQTMARRHEMYNETSAYISQREKEGAAFVIRPPKALEMSRTEHDPVKLCHAYNTGREEAERKLEELKAFLKAE